MADEDLNLYDEIEIEDCFFDETLQIYHHPCPCGDRFEISIYDMRDGEDIARCPSCSLMIRIIFDQVGEPWGSLRFEHGGKNVLMLDRATCPRRRTMRRARRQLSLHEYSGCEERVAGVALPALGYHCSSLEH